MFNLARVFMPHRKGIIIRDKVRRDEDIIYGGRAQNIQLPMPFQRHTSDFDIYSKKPKKHAMQLEQALDLASQGNYYYMKPALHRGTFKVMDIGFDKRKGTKDDMGIADYTKPIRKIKVVKVGGIKYAHLSERVKDAKRSLRHPEFKFRHEKDRKDLWLINQGKKMKGGLGW